MRSGYLVKSMGLCVAFEIDFSDSTYKYVSSVCDVLPGELLLVLERMQHPRGNFNNCNNALIKILTSKGTVGWIFEDQTEEP